MIICLKWYNILTVPVRQHTDIEYREGKTSNNTTAGQEKADLSWVLPVERPKS